MSSTLPLLDLLLRRCACHRVMKPKKSSYPHFYSPIWLSLSA